MTSTRRLFSKRPLSKRLMIGFVGLGAVAALTACGTPTDTTTAPADEEAATTEPDTTADSSMSEDMGDTVVSVAASDESFSTLAQAIEAAGLTETLSSEGPFTVFAPTNEAFEALPEGTLDQLLMPENQDLLTQILTYHVVPAEVTSAEVTAGDVETVAGPAINITTDGAIMVNEAMVVTPDVQASNGVIHAIDQVLLPPDVSL
ncbi:MAG TPA: fasciclin domain-containing protein [Elainellaceae cyanobacterium]